MALFTTIAQLQSYTTGVSAGVKYLDIVPSRDFIERNHIKPLLGDALYADLVEAFEDDPLPDNMANDMGPLYIAVMQALAPLTAWHFAGAAAAELSSGGQREHTAEDGAGARLWVSNLQRDTWYDTGMTEIDNLLAFLEANQDTYTDWLNSAGYSELRECLLQTTAQMNQVVHINHSRRFFTLMKPSIRHAEEMLVKKYIGADTYDDLIDKIKDDNLAASESALIGLLRKAIAHLCVSYSSLPIELGTDGAWVLSSTENASVKTKAMPEAIYTQKNHHKTFGMQYLNEAVDFLNKNAGALLFTDYYNSDLYQDPTADDYGKLENDNVKLNNTFAL